MRINRVTIENFRIYKGEINIIFSDNEQNITIIAGKNGFGKTTFLTALIWGFYGRLLSEVDEKYKKDIYESGGYKKFANSILNREIKLDKSVKKRFFVEIEISDIYIPSVPCRKIVIHREFNIDTDSEDCRILIDGSENELTKEVGSDIFINDFILPREIAKFFFFDAEKIVSLAEISTNIEKQNLSKAYSEVLGINKYELLKRSLENLRVKLRKKSASISDRNRLAKFQDDVNQLQKLISLNESKISDNKIDIDRAKSTSEQYQEKLIREGNNMSVEEMIRQKKLRDTLQQQGIEIKAKLKELIELAPFAIAGKKLKELKNQVVAESNKQQQLIDIEFIKSKFQSIQSKIEKRLTKAKISKELHEDISTILFEEIGAHLEEQQVTVQKILLDMTPEETNGFISIYDNLKHSYNLLIRQIVKEERNNRIFLAKTLRKIADAESKDSDVLAKKYKTEKAKIDKRIKELIDEQNKLFSELGAYRQELSTKSKILSELTKTVSLDEVDEKKDKVTSRLIEELSDFIFKFKAGKKDSLQTRLRKELHQLMHKENFIYDVSIEMIDDLIDIHLLDVKGEIINKETLSKGEQQLYATALLKSLVDESGIHFPVFIDSPLQKFDKEHSTNIISKFYPSISEQVVLFPLLEKELTIKEYSLLRKNVSQTFKIMNVNGKSIIEECNPNELFIDLEKPENVHTY
jgi:DNA sulfur modification protein DndD